MIHIKYILDEAKDKLSTIAGILTMTIALVAIGLTMLFVITGSALKDKFGKAEQDEE
jgi:hypothetical protein